jgi:hypothetical protein
MAFQARHHTLKARLRTKLIFPAPQASSLTRRPAWATLAMFYYAVIAEEAVPIHR